MTNAIWQRPDPVDAESEWEVFLSSKKQAMNRMKAGRVNALRRFGGDKSSGKSVISELSDDREAPASDYKETHGTRDAPESIKGDLKRPPTRCQDYHRM